jgi:hypothetical protein
MSIVHRANDKYRASLRSTWIADPAATTLEVDALPENVPTYVTTGWGTDYEAVFSVEGKAGDNASNYTLTGVTWIKGYAGNIPENTSVNCLTHEEFFNQYETIINSVLDAVANLVDTVTGTVKKIVTLIGRAETIYDNGNSGEAKTIDWENGSTQKLTLTDNCVLTFTNVPAGGYLTLYLLQDGEGSREVTWPEGSKYADGEAPTLTTTASSIDVIGIRAFATDEFHVVATASDVKAAS